MAASGKSPSVGFSIVKCLSLALGALISTYLFLLLWQHQRHFSQTHGHAKASHDMHRSSFLPKPLQGAQNTNGTEGGAGRGVSLSPAAARVSKLPALEKFGGADRPRIIFAVPMPWPLKDDLAKDNLVATISTWGAHAARLVLIVSESQIAKFPPDSELGEQHSQIKDYLYSVPMKRPDGIKNGRHIWEKMWRGWKLVADKYRFEADWFVKADLDTYIAVENMRAFLHPLNPDEPYYFGHSLFHDWKRHNLVFNSGTCYVLSRESVRRLAIRLERIEASRSFTYQCGDGDGAREDPHTAGCLRDVDVPASDSLDSEGKQRFLTFRPKDHLFAMGVEPGREATWFWMFKDTSKQLLDCCSSYPISFHNFKSHPRAVYEPEAYYRLEYYLSSHSYEGILQGIDPPRGQPFEIPEDLPFEVDDSRNCKGSEPRKTFGNWLRENPDAAACVNSDESCKCKIPESLPHLGPGIQLDEEEDGSSRCVLGGFIRKGGKCKLKCKEGYRALENRRRVDGQNELACPDGAILYPSKPLQCKMECTDAQLDQIRAMIKGTGDHLNERDSGASLACGPGRAMADGKKSGVLNCALATSEDTIQLFQCSECVSWKISLSGSRYTHDAWKTLSFDGSAATRFEVASVQTGSPHDPNKNCNRWNVPTQLILRVRGKEEPIAALSCGNQMIQIVDITKSPRTC
eukprot:CAMPEP_0184483376 /NCGR_PEP_ID=MMETSP0113_2-20130426/5027_1 /TAXON_ID=91329 /ORGANISM="Norrisiella sphaerica, Strain BC52" /LENGTH=687 /DNA_ID=CAMNT_0026863733 /DNA_START=153 /DNA_END=2216 /DNA_ORIENTATION=-